MGRKIKEVYIIDDDQVFVFGLKKMISIRNLCENILVFGNGLEAIEHLKSILSNPKLLPDVILLDMTMPVMDGWQFMEEFERIKHCFERKITIYMLTSSVLLPDIERAKSFSDITDYLVKPITLDDLEAILN